MKIRLCVKKSVATSCLAMALIAATDSAALHAQQSPAAAPASGQEVAADDLEAIERALGDAGWRAQFAADGSLLAYPPEVPAASKPAPAAPDQYSRFRDALTTHGWRVEQSSDGSIELYPPGDAARSSDAPASVPAKTPSEPADIVVDDSELDSLRAALTARGWQTEQHADGSLTLIAAGGNAVRRATSSVRAAMPADLSVTSVELPVDTWAEAKALAQGWLGENPGTSGSLVVGKIRRVNQIYLISIVESTRPYALRNQLAIRATDGRVVALL